MERKVEQAQWFPMGVYCTKHGLRAGTGDGDTSSTTDELRSLPELHLISGQGSAREEASSTVWFGLDLPAPEPCVNPTEGRAGCREGRGR